MCLNELLLLCQRHTDWCTHVLPPSHHAYGFVLEAALQRGSPVFQELHPVGACHMYGLERFADTRRTVKTAYDTTCSLMLTLRKRTIRGISPTLDFSTSLRNSGTILRSRRGSTPNHQLMRRSW